MRAADGMEARGQYPLTLVTAYFEVGRNHEYTELENPYPGWIRNFLPLVQWPLVIFCDEQSLGMLKEARGDKPAVWHVTRPEEFYAYRYLDDLKRLSSSAECAETFIARSLIWHEKHHFLRQALSENPFASEMLFWCDIAQFRHDPDAPLRSVWRRAFCLFEDIEWPSLRVCRELPQDKVILVSYGHDYSHFTAQFFGGAVEPSRRWCDAYYRCLEKRKQNGDFTHRDEHVMRSCFRRQRELAYVIQRRYVRSINFKLAYKWYLVSGRRFPWKYLRRRLFSGRRVRAHAPP